MALEFVTATAADQNYVLWVILGTGIVFGWFWLTQFIQLMLMSELDFPGRHDKILWTFAFLIVVPLAPFAFWGWKSAFREQLNETRNAPATVTEPVNKVSVPNS